jgi:hypothetical protein
VVFVKQPTEGVFDSAMEIEISVEYTIEPADPDVGIFSSEATIERVILGKVDILPLLTDGQVSMLEDDAFEDWSDDGSAEGDYRYEEMKDKRYEEDQ